MPRTTRPDRTSFSCLGKAFRDAESYAATKAHELTHWTSHPQRLARDFGAKRFGDTGYAREELVAEIGAAFCALSFRSPLSRARTMPATSRTGCSSCVKISARYSRLRHTHSVQWTSSVVSSLSMRSAPALSPSTPREGSPPFFVFHSAPSTHNPRRPTAAVPNAAPGAYGRTCHGFVGTAPRLSTNLERLRPRLFWLDPRAGVRGPARKV